MTTTTTDPRWARLTPNLGDSDRTGHVVIKATDGMTYEAGRALGLRTVALGHWSFSTTSGQGPHEAYVRVSARTTDHAGRTLHTHGVLHGALYGNTEEGREAAKAAAYEAGILGFFAYFTPAA